MPFGAGRRRFHAARTIAQEGGEIDPVPCAIMEAGDDVAALEASLIENIARLDPDEVIQWESFTRLAKEGRTIDDIAAIFGITDLMVRRVLALGNLLPRIRDLYRKQEIDAATIRHLTLAGKARQKEWLALHSDPEAHAPTGRQLKSWLFGGQSISTTAALFSLETYKGRIVSDLFGEEAYFAEVDLFWQAQNEAIAAKRDVLLDAGWNGVELLEPGRHFHSWEYEKTSKAKGGKVFIAVSHRGEVEIHEGWLDGKEARRARAEAARAMAGAAETKPARPEVTSAMQTYIDLHRHAAIRAVLADHPAVALRLMVAHAIAGSPLWTMRVEPQRARNDAIAESVETSPGEARFDERRRAVLALLGFSPEEPTVVGGNGDEHDLAGVFARLLTLSDDNVLAVAAIVMGETLEAGSAVVEAVGAYLNMDMTSLWQADDIFFDLIRDRQVANAMLREVGGRQVADGNAVEKVKTQKAVIRDFLAGGNGRRKVEGWTPRWFAFPPAGYTARPFQTLARWKQVEAAIAGLSAPQMSQTETESLISEPPAIAAE